MIKRVRYPINLTVTTEEKQELREGIKRVDKFTAKVMKYALKLVRKTNV